MSLVVVKRALQASVESRLTRTPAVVLLGPRQVGKTTLARQIAAARPGALFLDLERSTDRDALSRPDLFFAAYRDNLVVLDEVQFVPALFSALRPEIDSDRRPGRFLLLGSAAGALLHQSSESLAGRAAWLELTPFQAAELEGRDLLLVQELWLRGGFPPSYLAFDKADSFVWRQDFIRTFLQRDLPELGVRLPAETTRRFWSMLAHLQGQLLNASQLGVSLGGASHTTVGRHLDLLVDTMMVRRLPPVLANVGKRLVKSPKVYLRDSGVLHALLGIASVRDLQGHAVAGASWEGFVVEQIAAMLPGDAQMGFYRTQVGAELDLVIERGARRIGIEIKFSSAPKVQRGFWQALDDLQIDRAFVVAPVERRYPLTERVDVLPIWALDELLTG